MTGFQKITPVYSFRRIRCFLGRQSIWITPGELWKDLWQGGKTVGILSNSTQASEKEKEKLFKHGLIENKHFHFYITSGDIAKGIFQNERLPFNTKNKKYFAFCDSHPKYLSHKKIFKDTPYQETDAIAEVDFIYATRS